MASISSSEKTLDKFGDAYTTEDWDSGPDEKYVHKSCCKPELSKHPVSKLSLISYDNAWGAFKRHTVPLEDQKMHDRINCVIDYAADDPYVIEIRYHNKCWLKYLRSYQKMSEDNKIPRMHNVNLLEAQTIFFDYIRTVIFEEHELRSLQSLLKDSIMSQYGFPTPNIRSSFIKDILTLEFVDKIDFHARPKRKESDILYDKSGGEFYVEAALSAIGVSSEQLVYNRSSLIEFMSSLRWSAT